MLAWRGITLRSGKLIRRIKPSPNDLSFGSSNLSEADWSSSPPWMPVVVMPILGDKEELTGSIVAMRSHVFECRGHVQLLNITPTPEQEQKYLGFLSKHLGINGATPVWNMLLYKKDNIFDSKDLSSYAIFLKYKNKWADHYARLAKI